MDRVAKTMEEKLINGAFSAGKVHITTKSMRSVIHTVAFVRLHCFIIFSWHLVSKVLGPPFFSIRIFAATVTDTDAKTSSNCRNVHAWHSRMLYEHIANK